MNSTPRVKQNEQDTINKCVSYETPAVIYEGFISTRAGSPLGKPSNNPAGVDPADLFGE